MGQEESQVWGRKQPGSATVKVVVADASGQRTQASTSITAVAQQTKPSTPPPATGESQAYGIGGERRQNNDVLHTSGGQLVIR